MRTIKIVLVGTVVAAAVMGCTPSQRVGGFVQAQTQLSGVVGIEVDAGQTEASVTNSENPACDKVKKRNFRKGCFKVKKGDDAVISFEFSDSAQANTWHFKSFRVCQWDFGDDDPPADTCTLPVENRLDFAVVQGASIELPDNSGTIDLSGFGQLNAFSVLNRNQVQEDYFYWVTVCKDAAPGTCLSADPGSRNGGKK